MVEGHGSWLQDEDGKRYLDFIQGWAVNALGHSPARCSRRARAHPAATADQRRAGVPQRPDDAPGGSIAGNAARDRVFFANSGGEANEGAIKLARSWGARHRNGAYEIVTFAHAFHGRTIATMAASGKPAFRDRFEPKVPGFPKVPLNDLAAVERQIAPQTVAVMLEPIQGEAGVWPAEDWFLRDLRV